MSPFIMEFVVPTALGLGFISLYGFITRLRTLVKQTIQRATASDDYHGDRGTRHQTQLSALRSDVFATCHERKLLSERILRLEQDKETRNAAAQKEELHAKIRAEILNEKNKPSSSLIAAMRSCAYQGRTLSLVPTDIKELLDLLGEKDPS